MSDQPGHDRQKSTAFAINSQWDKSAAVTINTILTTNRTDAEYGYDEDWTGTDLQPSYQAFDNYSRDIARDSAEVRWVSGPMVKIAGSDWLLGIYYQKSTIDLVRDYDGFWGEYDISELFDSNYKTSSASLFAQASTPIKPNLALTSGLRYENWQSDYADSNQIDGKNDEHLFGGKFALELTTEAMILCSSALLVVIKQVALMLNQICLVSQIDILILNISGIMSWVVSSIPPTAKYPII